MAEVAADEGTFLNEMERAVAIEKKENIENKVFSGTLPIFEVKQNFCTLEWSPYYSEAEDTFLKAKGKASVYVLNKEDGFKYLVMNSERRIIFDEHSLNRSLNLLRQEMSSTLLTLFGVDPRPSGSMASGNKRH